MVKIRKLLVFLCLVAIAARAGSFIFVAPAMAQSAVSTLTFSRNLGLSDIGSDVTLLQQFLISKGLLAAGDSTGYFGPLTEAAVANWQTSADVPNTGYFGPLSRAAIENEGSINMTSVPNSNFISTQATTGISADSPSLPATSSTTTYPENLSIGTHGTEVSSLQSFLIAKNFLSISAPTGNFGALTFAAVASWQASIGLPSTGYFGPLSRAAIEKFEGAAAASGAVNSGSSATSPAIIPSEPPSAPAPASGGINGNSSTPVPPPANIPTPVVSSGSDSGPTTPSGLFVTAISSSSISFAWSGSVDPGNAIEGYKIYQNGTPIGTITIPAFTSTGLTPATTYTYSVSAYDFTGSASPISSSLNATTVGASAPSVVVTPPPSTNTPPPVSTPPPAPITLTTSGSLNYNYGLSVGDSLLGLSSSTLNQELNTMVSLGVGWVRFDMEWDNIQSKNSSVFNWSDIDPVVVALDAHGIKTLAILDYTPSWAESSTCSAGSNFCAPSDPAFFAAFAKAAVQRYASEGVSAWEIWNEPNNAGFWGPHTSCSAYTTLLQDAYTAIKQVQPNSTVITGGLAPESTDGSNMSPTDFLSCIYASGGKNYFDVVGDHPYTFPQMPSNDNGGAWDQMSATSPSLRSIMIANGDANKKIWVTEFGTPTNGPNPAWYVSEAQQAMMVTSAFTTYSTYSWGGPFFWYTYKDGGTSTDTNENFFGLLRSNESTKPAYTTLQTLLSSKSL